ncbi:hypothetical protein ECC02_012137 [Trypanosoma cruzi]|uniref:Uncharacterized protein n=1 Tax=Trypanosoma cruzi TaxID=5693 RepID=A0A7J6XLU9_TRYCR|nr:hypothetical protein ECC02_012137 [Trypanosoma cruzi]
MTTNRCIHAAATAPYERYMTTNRGIHAAAAAPYERYMTTNRGIHAAAAHPKHVAFVFQGTTQMCSIVRRSKLTPSVKMGRATTFFLAQWQTSSIMSSCHPGRGSKPRRSLSFFFPFFFFLEFLVSYCFFKLLVCRTVCESSAIALIPSVSWQVRCGCGGGRVRVREREPCTARTHARLSLSVCVCPLALTLALTSPHEAHT